MLIVFGIIQNINHVQIILVSTHRVLCPAHWLKMDQLWMHQKQNLMVLNFRCIQSTSLTGRETWTICMMEIKIQWVSCYIADCKFVWYTCCSQVSKCLCRLRIRIWKIKERSMHEAITVYMIILFLHIWRLACSRYTKQSYKDKGVGGSCYSVLNGIYDIIFAQYIPSAGRSMVNISCGYLAPSNLTWWLNRGISSPLSITLAVNWQHGMDVPSLKSSTWSLVTWGCSQWGKLVAMLGGYGVHKNSPQGVSVVRSSSPG